MTSPAALFRKSKCAIWTATAGDSYGDTYSLLGVYPCQFINDGKLQRDATGQEFTPSAVFSVGVKPKVGDFIAVVSSTPAEMPAEAMQVRKVTSGTALHGSADYLVYTA